MFNYQRVWLGIGLMIKPAGINEQFDNWTIWKMDIADLPIQRVIFHSYVGVTTLPPGKRLHKYGQWTGQLMGKLTISMAIFNSYVSHFYGLRMVVRMEKRTVLYNYMVDMCALTSRTFHLFFSSTCLILTGRTGGSKFEAGYLQTLAMPSAPHSEALVV